MFAIRVNKIDDKYEVKIEQSHKLKFFIHNWYNKRPQTNSEKLNKHELYDFIDSLKKLFGSSWALIENDGCPSSLFNYISENVEYTDKQSLLISPIEVVTFNNEVAQGIFKSVMETPKKKYTISDLTKCLPIKKRKIEELQNKKEFMYTLWKMKILRSNLISIK